MFVWVMREVHTMGGLAQSFDKKKFEILIFAYTVKSVMNNTVFFLYFLVKVDIENYRKQMNVYKMS